MYVDGCCLCGVQLQEEASTSGQEAAVGRETDALFGNVLQGPPSLTPPSQPTGPTGAGNTACCLNHALNLDCLDCSCFHLCAEGCAIVV